MQERRFFGFWHLSILLCTFEVKLCICAGSLSSLRSGPTLAGLNESEDFRSRPASDSRTAASSRNPPGHVSEQLSIALITQEENNPQNQRHVPDALVVILLIAGSLPRTLTIRSDQRPTRRVTGKPVRGIVSLRELTKPPARRVAQFSGSRQEMALRQVLKSRVEELASIRCLAYHEP